MPQEFDVVHAGKNTWRYFWDGPYRQWLLEYLDHDEVRGAHCMTELMFRVTEPPENASIVSVDPLAKWIVMDRTIFDKWYRYVEELHFVFFFAFLCIMDYKRDVDRLDMVRISEHVQRVPNWEFIMDTLEIQGIRLPYGIDKMDILNPRRKKIQGTRMVRKTRKKREKPVSAFRCIMLRKYFDAYHGYTFYDTETKSARDRASEAYYMALDDMRDKKGFAFRLNDDFHVRMDYYPNVTPSSIDYMMVFELFAGDRNLGIIEELELDEENDKVRFGLRFMKVELSTVNLGLMRQTYRNRPPKLPGDRRASRYSPPDDESDAVDIDASDLDRILSAPESRELT